MSQFVTLEVKDASPMRAYVATPEGSGPFPGVIVFQEAFGVNGHMRHVTDRIAKLGYIAIAPEVFHRTAAPGQEFSYSDFPSVMPHYQAMTNEGMIADGQACLDWLVAREDVVKDKVGCIGFCLGGRIAFVANSALPLAASVAYYGGGMHTVADLAEKLHGPQLMLWGGKDTHITPEHVQTVVDALIKADKDYINVVISYAAHAFSCDDRPAFHPQAASEAWGLTTAFFKNKLG